MTERCRLTTPPRRVLSVFSVFSVFSVLSVPLPAQTVRVTGRVVSADSSPVPGVRVVLHRVGQNVQGPIDSSRSGPEGGFRFSFRPETSAFYLVSGRYAGIEYFSVPLATKPSQPDTGVRIVVYDTSSSAPVALEARHLVLTRPSEDGSRSVLDLIILRNSGRLTRVAPDTLQGSWSVPLPRGTAGLQVSESDVSAASVSRAGDSLIVNAALAPGEKQLTIQYQVPAGRKELELPLEPQGLSLNLLVEEPGVKVVAPNIAPADSQVIQGRWFRRWAGTVSSVGVVRLILPGADRTPSWLLPALVGTLALGLVAAGWYALAYRRSPGPDLAPEQLIDAIAALDARYLGRRDETAAEEWKAYEAERMRLKRELEAALAAGGRSS
jgi:hypothetical protein